ncbi:MAG: gamma-glutamyl-gamma-aminobutyrate hydrolase family protein [Lachnospiraceae bacterium]|nr:gamma-glutamyl-gamma-aminobutyrate hydrolase family protein [Lachnospiraceae bacterium]
MKRPIIGITCNFDYKDDVGMVSCMGITGQQWHFVADNYVDSVERAGGVPVLIPICANMETVWRMVEGMDGILISGGHDVNPQEYGERANGKCGRLMPRRDRQDIALARHVLNETMKPILAICRGIQIMNVAAGGTLYQDLESEGFEHHFTDMYPLNEPTHTVEVKEDSILRGIFGKERVRVNSFHHQAVKRLAEGFVVDAVSEDGVTEGIEPADGRFALGIQWHPEMMYDSEEQLKLFRALVEACRE